MAPSLLLFSFALIIITLSIIPSALSETDQENYMRDLCDDNIRPDQCWEIIKTNWDGFNTNEQGVACTSISLTRGKAVEIIDLLNHLQGSSDNEELRGKYQSCVNNYNDVIRDIDQAKNYLDSGNMGIPDYVSSQIHTVLDDFEECRHNFDDSSVDPGHVMDRNKELFVYAQIAKASAERFEAKRQHIPTQNAT